MSKDNTIIDLMFDYLDEVDDNKEEKIKRIKEMQDMLNYNLRLTELSDKEKENFVRTMSGEGLVTEGMRDTLNKCKSVEEKDYYIDMWARSTYFRQCAWLQYLHGETNEKPITPEH